MDEVWWKYLLYALKDAIIGKEDRTRAKNKVNELSIMIDYLDIYKN
jgi:hypothetical protein